MHPAQHRSSEPPDVSRPVPAAPDVLGGLSEAGVLERVIAASVVEDPRIEVGPGDDAAVVRLASPRLVVSTDTLTEGQDFLLDATTGAWIGTKAAVQNLADIAAMGARPSALVVAVTAAAETPVELLAHISTALSRRAVREGAAVVGGDLGAGPVLSVTVTAMGSLPEGAVPIRRAGARPGDVVAVGADALGRSAAGLAWILAGRSSEPEAVKEVAWHNAPDPDLALGWTAARAPDGSPRATAMIDISDGLVRDARRIASASGAVLDLSRAALSSDASALVPHAEALEADPWAWVLHGGEEHAMLATFDPRDVPAGFRVIGAVRDPEDAGSRRGEVPQVLLDGAEVPGEGFDHFA